MGKRLSIDPITRLEGHGRIDLYLDDAGAVERAHLVIPELRGFEKFLEGRPVEELPLITPRICGVCPEAHHAAAAKACDAVYGVQIPPAAELIRRLQYNAFTAGDHATHFFALGGPDFVVGPDADPAERNVIGVIKRVGVEVGGLVIRMRKEAHEVARILGGRTVHAVGMIPGGQSKAVSAEEAARIREIGAFMVEFARLAQKVFDRILANDGMRSLILSEAYTSRTAYLGLLNDDGQPDPYDGRVRVVGPDGAELAWYDPADYLDHWSEHVEPWSYLKFPYLKQLGWQGLTDETSGAVVRTGPLGTINAAKGMQTPRAQEAYERFFATLGDGPVHQTFAYHWARLIEMMQAAELVVRYAADPLLTDPEVRAVPTETPREGVGTVEAPRGLLTHHYVTDENGIVQRVNLIVGTTYNYPAIQLSVAKAAAALVKPGAELTEGVMNRIEMAFRAYDPCFGCATHSLPGAGPLEVRAFGADGALAASVRRLADGSLEHFDARSGEVTR